MPSRAILQVCTNFRPGGIQRHVLDLAAWLRARGWRVELAGDGGAWADGVEGLHPVPLARVAGSGPLPHRLAGLLLAAGKLRRIVARGAFDLVHVHETAPALAVRLATLGRALPVVFTCHGYARGRERAVARIARHAASRLLTPSERVARELAATGRLPAERIAVAGVAVPPPTPPAPETVAAERRRLLGAAGARLMITVARLAPQKGLDVLLDAAARVAAARDDVRFAVVGDGPLAGELRERAERSGLGGQVAFLGFRDDVASWLAAADLFVLPSRWEALPISIVEAFHAGLPVVATDCGGVGELVDDRVGALVPVEDPAALATELLALCDDEGRRARCSAAARERARSPRFAPEPVHRGILEQYERMLAGSARAGAA